MYRTRFKKEIVAEFLPPARQGKKTKIIILCDGLPSIPRKQPLAEFLAKKGFWVVYPRYRGTWESEGSFLEMAPDKDISDVIDELPNGLTDIAFGQHFSIPSPHEVYVIGGSFGGTTALMASLDPRVKKVIANCPVVDWAILPEEQKQETSNKNYAAYIREAFGSAYRLSDKNWKKIESETFFNPAKQIHELNKTKIMVFHAKNDPYIPWKGVKAFCDTAKIRINILATGGHLSTIDTVQTHWSKIKAFFEEK